MLARWSASTAELAIKNSLLFGSISIMMVSLFYTNDSFKITIFIPSIFTQFINCVDINHIVDENQSSKRRKQDPSYPDLSVPCSSDILDKLDGPTHGLPKPSGDSENNPVDLNVIHKTVGLSTECGWIPDSQQLEETSGSPDDTASPCNSQESLQGSKKSSQSILDDLSDSITQSTPDIDDEYHDIEKESREKFQLLKSFFHTLSNGELKIDYKWRDESVSDRVQRTRAKILDNMVQYLLETIFPGADESAYQNIIDRAFHSESDNSSSLVLEKIVEAYNNTQSKQIKKFLIMELTLVKKFQELQDILPGLTLYQYKAAQKTVKQSGLTKMPNEGYKTVTRNRRDYDSTVYFVNFFSSFVRVGFTSSNNITYNLFNIQGR